MTDTNATQYKRAYEWLVKNPTQSLGQAAIRFHVNVDSLGKALKTQYNYDAKAAQKKRHELIFEETCKLWPEIKHQLDTTNRRALDIIRSYGHGQWTLNKLVQRFEYDIETRANRIRQENRERTQRLKKPRVETPADVKHHKVKLVHSLPLKELWRAVA